MDKKASLFTGTFPISPIFYHDDHSTSLIVFDQQESESDLNMLRITQHYWKCFTNQTVKVIYIFWRLHSAYHSTLLKGWQSAKLWRRKFATLNQQRFKKFFRKWCIIFQLLTQDQIQYLVVIFVYILWPLSKLSFNDIVFNSYVFVKNVFKWIEMWVCKHLWEGLGHIIARYKRVYPLTRGMKNVTNLNSWFWKSHHIDLTQSVLNLLDIWGYSISVFYSKTLLQVHHT